MVILLFVLSVLSAPAQTLGDTRGRSTTHSFVRTDTVSRIDTIVTRDVIKRTEVVTRTDYVLRTDTLVHTSKGVIILQGKELIPEGVVAVADTVQVIPAVVEPLPEASIGESADSLQPVLPKKEGGEYVWVPDSLAATVDALLSGTPLPQVAMKAFDEHEKVTFRGDTIPMLLRDRNLGRFDRGLFNYLFIPRGMWQIGMTASYGELSTEDLEMFDLLSDVDISGRIFSIRPYFSYFIRNNISVGMRLSYTSGRANIDSFQVDIDDDMNFNLKDIMYRSEQYTAAMTFSQYFGIARRGRFGIFNEVELAFSSGNSDFQRPYDSKLKTTHTTTMQAALNFSPGVAVFILDNISFNVSFGVFGFSLRNEKQQVDGVDTGSRFSSGANFRFNIFNINLGIAVNI